MPDDWSCARPRMTALKRIALFAVLVTCWCRFPIHAQESNLIEIAGAKYGEGMDLSVGPYLVPPMVAIYQSGRIVFRNDRGIWEGRINEKRLQELRRKLAGNELLQKSQFLTDVQGEPLGSRDMAYLRYLDAANEVIVAVHREPSKGPWLDLFRLVLSYCPWSHHTFVPKEVKVRIFKGHPDLTPVPWPFKDELSLRGREDGSFLTLSDPRMIEFLMGQPLSEAFSTLELATIEDGSRFSLEIESVPDWYGSPDLQRTLGRMAAANEKVFLHQQ